jgi:hypothetical protein
VRRHAPMMRSRRSGRQPRLGRSDARGPRQPTGITAQAAERISWSEPSWRTRREEILVREKRDARQDKRPPRVSSSCSWKWLGTCACSLLATSDQMAHSEAPRVHAITSSSASRAAGYAAWTLDNYIILHGVRCPTPPRALRSLAWRFLR